MLVKFFVEFYLEIIELNDGDYWRICVIRFYEVGVIVIILEDSEDVEDGSLWSFERNGLIGLDKLKLLKWMSLFIIFKFDGLFNFNLEEFLKKKFLLEEEECWFEFLCFYDMVSCELYIIVI